MPSEDEVITGSVAITEADLVRGIGDHSAFYRLRWFIAVMFVAAAAVVILLGSSGPLAQWAPTGSCLGLVCVWAFVAPKFAAKKILGQLVRAGDNQVFYRFDGEGGTIRASGSTTTFAYRVVTRVRESATTLFVTVGNASTSIVPKRAFSPADLARLQAVLAANVKTEKAGSGKVFKLVVVWAALVFAFVVVWQLLNARPR
jgi:hypothetical protein